MTCAISLRRRPAPTGIGSALRCGDAARRTARGLRDLMASDAPLGQLVRFAVAGGFATAVQVMLFLLLAPAGVLLANGAAWVGSTALANELHRRRTFHADGRIDWLTAQWEGAGLALLGLGITTGALATLTVVVPDAGAPVQALLVLVVNVTVGVGRFLALRWAFVLRLRPA